MEIEYERTLTGSYMKIAAACNDGFDEKIMLKNKMPGFLKVEKSHVNGEGMYWYDISGYQSLAVICQFKKLDINFIEKFILTLCDQIETMERNLVDINCLLLDADTIFIANMDESIRYVIYPEGFESLSVYVRDVMEYMLTKLDHSNKAEVQTVYDIYEKTLDSDYSIMDIKDMILKRRQEAVKEQVSYETIADVQLPEIIEDKPEPISDKASGSENKILKKLSDLIEEYLGINLIELFKPRESKLRESKSRESKSRENKPYKEKTYGDKSSDTEKKKKRKTRSSRHKSELVVEPEREAADTYSQRLKEQKSEPVKQIHPTVCLTDYREHPQGLLLYEGYEGLGNITITGQETRIGLSEEMDAVIDKTTISRIHACIAQEDGEFYLSDMNSSNGTFVNDKPVAYRERCKLKTNDIVRFADVKYRFV